MRASGIKHRSPSLYGKSFAHWAIKVMLGLSMKITHSILEIQKQMTPSSKYLIWQCLLGGFPGLARAVMGENTVHQEVSLPVSLYCSAFLKQVCITFVIRKSNKEKLFP